MDLSNGRPKAIAIVALLVAAEMMHGAKTEDELLDLIRGVCTDETEVLAVAMTVAYMFGVQVDAVEFTAKGGE